jgi:hypothetical protein
MACLASPPPNRLPSNPSRAGESAALESATLATLESASPPPLSASPPVLCASLRHRTSTAPALHHQPRNQPRARPHQLRNQPAPAPRPPCSILVASLPYPYRIPSHQPRPCRIPTTHQPRRLRARATRVCLHAPPAPPFAHRAASCMRRGARGSSCADSPGRGWANAGRQHGPGLGRTSLGPRGPQGPRGGPRGSHTGGPRGVQGHGWRRVCWADLVGAADSLHSRSRAWLGRRMGTSLADTAKEVPLAAHGHLLGAGGVDEADELARRGAAHDGVVHHHHDLALEHVLAAHTIPRSLVLLLGASHAPQPKHHAVAPCSPATPALACPPSRAGEASSPRATRPRALPFAQC